MMLGFQTFIVDQLVNNDSHIRISAREELVTVHSLTNQLFGEDQNIRWLKPPTGRRDNAFILAPGEWGTRLSQDDRVSAFSPQLVIQGIATVGKISLGVSIVGIEPERQLGVSNIEDYMVQGKFSAIGTTGNRISIGADLLQKLGAAPGEIVMLGVGKNAPQPFRISSVFRLGVKGLDESRIFASLLDVQRVNETPGRISDIAVRLRDVNKANEVASTYSILSVDKVQSWDQANEGIMSVFKTQDIVRNFMTISILIVAGFGIYNILSLAVTHKRREIAILRSMGFEPRDITRLFLIQGVALGLAGGLLGILVGFAACYGMAQIEVSSNRGLGGNHMMISYDIMIYVKAFALALGASSFAGYFPARAAGLLEPIEIIRGENS